MQRGKVKALEDKIFSSDKLDLEETFSSHTGIAHTRWATHGIPNEVNSHPQRSCDNNDFVIIHNGIITNYKTIKTFLESHNYQFESDTDTEVIAKLIKYLWDNREKEAISFITLVERVIQQLEGAFALVFKSRLFPGQCVACKRGSPMVIGISSRSKLSTDNIPIMYSSCKITNLSEYKNHRKPQEDKTDENNGLNKKQFVCSFLSHKLHAKPAVANFINYKAVN